MDAEELKKDNYMMYDEAVETKLYWSLQTKDMGESYEGYKIFYLYADNENGFNIGSLFAVPKDLSDINKFGNMVVRFNDTGESFQENTDEELAENMVPQMKKLIEDMREVNAPLFMPILPTNENGIDYQKMEPEIFNNIVVEEKYRNIPKQIEAAFDAARLQINKLTGKQVPDRMFLSGTKESSKGLVRFAFLLPNRIDKICVNNEIESIISANARKNGNLSYPEGSADYQDIAETNFSDIVDQYKDIEILYIGNNINEAKKKSENVYASGLKRSGMNMCIKFFDGRQAVDAKDFYRYGIGLYKEETWISKLISKLKGIEMLLLPEGNSAETVENTSENKKPGELTPDEKVEYENQLESQLANAKQANTNRTGKVGINRLQATLAHDREVVSR